MRGDSLPEPVASDEDIREPDHDIVRNVAVFAPTVGTSGDDRRIPEHSNPHIVDLYGHDAMDSALERVTQHVATCRNATIRSRHCPIWRDDLLDGRPIGCDPGPGEPLLNVRKLSVPVSHA